MDARHHPFAAKVTIEQANDIRRLRRAGVQLAEIANRFRIAKSSVSAIVHFHVHVPLGVVRVVLPDFEYALLAEIARDEDIAQEQLASELLAAALLAGPER